MKRWRELPAGEVHAAEQRFRVALGRDADFVIGRINSDSRYVERLAAFAIRGGFEPTPSQIRARDIMGRNFFGIDSAIRYLGVKPGYEELACLQEIPYSEETLKECQSTHLLVAVLRFSLAELYARFGHLLHHLHIKSNEDFFTTRESARWLLVRKQELAGSCNRTYKQQLELSDDTEEVPSACALAYAIIGYYEATGKELFEFKRVRTLSRESKHRDQ